MRAVMLERRLLYVLRAEPNPFSKLLLVYPFAFRPSASVCSGADSVCSGNWEGRMSVVCSGALRLTGAASYALTAEKDSAGAFACGRELCWAVLNEDSRT